MPCVKENNWRKVLLVKAVITLALAVFDVGTDWWALKDYIIYGGKITLTYAIAFFCVVSTLLCILEVRNSWYALKVHRSAIRGKQDVNIIELQSLTKIVNKRRPLKDAEKNLNLWQEIVAFLLLVMEDLPVTIILYITFTQGPCNLFWRIFEESSTANLAVLGTFLSSLWKVLVAVIFCCCRCCNYHDIDGLLNKVGCCFCRMMRPMFAFVLIGFSAFLYFTFNTHGIDSRSDCMHFNESSGDD